MRRLYLCAAALLIAGTHGCGSINPSKPTGDAYILVDATREEQHRTKPRWIGLLRGGTTEEWHVPAGEAIFALPPGDYTLDHIDFTVGTGGDARTIGIGGDMRLDVEAVENTITLVGLVVIKSRENRAEGDSALELTLMRDKQIVAWACETHESLMERLPVRLVNADGTDRLVRIRCKRFRRGA